MMRRIVKLWQKEAAHHALAVLGMCVLLALIGLVQWFAVVEDPLATSQLDVANNVLIGFVPIGALVLGHRCVVREYHAKTQLFLEALPMRRWEFVLAKYAFGWAVLGGLTLLLLGAVALAASESDPKHLFILSLRAVGWVAACWSMFFALGLLGRLRIPVYVAIVIGVYALDLTTAFEIRRFAPIALIDPSTFTYERDHIPWRQLLETGALSTGFVALAVALSLVREGSVAEILARPASQREKSALVVFAVVTIMIVSVVTDEKPRRPFEFTSDAVHKSSAADVAVMYGWPELEPHALVTLRELEAFSQRLERDLRVTRRPPIRVAHRSTLLGDTVVIQHLPDADGVLLEANLAAQAGDLGNLLYTAAHASFAWITQGRATFEPDHWLLDGFSAWWALEQRPGDREQLWLAGLVAARYVDARPDTIAHWERVMETTGERLANGFAATALFVLADRHGSKAVLELGRTRLAHPIQNDVRNWLRSRKTPLAQHFAAVTGESWPDFVRVWRAEIAQRSAQGPLADKLRRIPAPAATLRLQRGRTGAEIVYRLSGSPPETDRSCALLHAELQPYDLFVESESLTREAVQWPAGQREVNGSLRGRYGKGQRVLAALECSVPELSAPIRLRVLRDTAP